MAIARRLITYCNMVSTYTMSMRIILVFIALHGKTPRQMTRCECLSMDVIQRLYRIRANTSFLQHYPKDTL